MTNAKNKKILVIDDELSIRELFKSILTDDGFEVFEASCGQEAVDTFQSKKPDLAIVDNFLPDFPGLEVIKRIRVFDGKTPLLMITGLYTPALEKSARTLGVIDFLRKDQFQVKSFLKRVNEILKL
jgi:DNA-binding response OmpR family regulator